MLLTFLSTPTVASCVTNESTIMTLSSLILIETTLQQPISCPFVYTSLSPTASELSPNTITVASIFIGIAAGICFYYQSLTINIIGMLLLIWANSYDSADGQLARMTGKKTPLGRILDGTAGDCWFMPPSAFG